MIVDVVPTYQHEARFHGFYSELRRKYPNTFALAGGLGREEAITPLKKLPHLEQRPLLHPGVLPSPSGSPTTPDSRQGRDVLHRVDSSSSRWSQVSKASARPHVIVRNRIVAPVLQEDTKGSSRQLKLPTLTTQVEQNRAALRRRLYLNTGPAARTPDSPLVKPHPPNQPRSPEPSSAQPKSSGATVQPPKEVEDPSSPRSLVRIVGFGTSELLPSKPKLELQEAPGGQSVEPGSTSRLSASDSDADSGISMGFPASSPPTVSSASRPQAPLVPRSGIITHHKEGKTGPLKADHSIPIPPKYSTPLKESPRQLKPPGRPETAKEGRVPSRVRFRDESIWDVESRFRERFHQNRTTTDGSCEDLLCVRKECTPLASEVNQVIEKTPVVNNKKDGPHSLAKGNGDREPPCQQLLNAGHRQQGPVPGVLKGVRQEGAPAKGAETCHEKSRSASRSHSAELPADQANLKADSEDKEGLQGAKVAGQVRPNSVPQNFSMPEQHNGLGQKYLEFNPVENQQSVQSRLKKAERDTTDLMQFYTKVKRTLKATMKRMQTPKATEQWPGRGTDFDSIGFVLRAGVPEGTVHITRKERLYLVRDSPSPAPRNGKQDSVRRTLKCDPPQRKPTFCDGDTQEDKMRAAHLDSVEIETAVSKKVQPFMRKGRSKGWHGVLPVSEAKGDRAKHRTGWAVVQRTNPDGSVLVEWGFPARGPAGIGFSKGFDRGVYVAQVTVPYAEGILGVGDRILKFDDCVAEDLSLDEISWRMSGSDRVQLLVKPSGLA
ncbi:uncharacterized protein LOC120536073 isoform X1 [Polypterus senegalus]|uniref:uncharacterized protein LOC120536073 isoform X1 n=1 Tax=Polypterus senegalus TaxID=55291 RepID=UPI0019622B52|nr:uncharacterized protein LOC120536073 isoform X1 [Polypterus senegalus]